ncbi:polysaccharide deacetylase family protein [Cohnella yongneupensis]|uniref:Polysaccharide deacetylase family protein n=1 Tax=Cohnella yongneupensis TaxID=425006 RepID=A0ABW0R1A9_9BACL
MFLLASISNAVPVSGEAALTPTTAVPSVDNIPILIYHSFSEIPEELNDNTVSPDKFLADMQALIDNGYTPIFFKDYLDAQENKFAMPAKPIFITIDDGYYSVYKYAYPILRELKLKATISVIGWAMGRSTNKDNRTAIFAHFSWNEAKEMYDSGYIDIQHHTWDLHNESGKDKEIKGLMKLPKESDAAYAKRIKADFLKLKTKIESEIGNKVIVFTYPYGSTNATAEKALKEAGAKFTLTTTSGVSDIKKSPYLLKRINAAGRIKSEDLIKKIEKLSAPVVK